MRSKSRLRRRASRKNLSTITHFKEAVVIGNGPSAISLSYMLAGNWPYYGADESTRHPEDFLHRRLSARLDVSVVQQDLEHLSEGLEGRSCNPVSLLFDALNQPGPDLTSLLKWKHHPQYAIEHAVIGHGFPGGSWQSMGDDIMTVSDATWMDLPGYRFTQWETSRGKERLPGEIRASAASVAQYFKDYVEIQGLSDNFFNQCTVTSAKPVDRTHLSLQLGANKLQTLTDKFGSKQQLWEVRCCCSRGGLRFITPCVILATGGFDMPNALNVVGEDLPNVLTSLPSFRALVNKRYFKKNKDPVIIIGAGLSAADAILIALSHNIPVVHVFRRKADDSALVFRQLPKAVYPEYHCVFDLMKGAKTADVYKAYAQHHVLAITPEGIHLKGHLAAFCLKFSAVVALLGSKPNLSFLPNKGQDLAALPQKPLCCRNNPVNVNLYTLESVSKPGLYAMGPLICDNFVRFAQGGALAITQSLCIKFKGLNTQK